MQFSTNVNETTKVTEKSATVISHMILKIRLSQENAVFKDAPKHQRWQRSKNNEPKYT